MWQQFRQFSFGSNYSNSDVIKRPDEVKLLNGCNVDHKVGSIVKDNGYAQLGAALQAGKNITGLFNFRQALATQKLLATVDDASSDDTQLFYSIQGAWTELTDAETAWANKAGINVEMAMMDSYCYFVGWGATDGFVTPISLIGTTVSTSTNVTNMPNAKFIVQYRDRMYLLNTDISGTATPYRVYYSTVPSAGSITWTVATNFLDVDYGEYITGGGENWDRLVIFTDNSTYMYNQSEWKKVFDVGCSAHRTIKNSGAFMLWANADGVWMSTGGRPLNIAGKMMDFIKAGTPSKFFAEVTDEEYHLYLGSASIVVDGVTYSNPVLIYNIPHQTWRLRELFDTPTIFATYNLQGRKYLCHGDTDGEVMKYSKYDQQTLYNPTISIASPGVVTFTDHGLTDGDNIKFTTTGALPTGITAGTTYYVIADSIATGTFRFSATYGGSAVNTTGSQSGTHTITVNPMPSDDGNPIRSTFETNQLDFGEPQDQKTISRIIVYTERGMGLELKARIIDSNYRVVMEYKPLGECKKYINEFTCNPNKGNFLQIKGSERGVNPYWIFDGFSIMVNTSTDKK